MSTEKTREPRRVQLTGGQVQDIERAYGQMEFQKQEFQRAERNLHMLIGRIAALSGHKENGVMWEVVRDDEEVFLVEVLADVSD